MHTKILIDSTIDVSPALKDRFAVIPLTIHVSGREFIDGVTMTADAFYRSLLKSKELPTTSQPTPAAFAQVFESLTDDGSEVVALTISSKVSGTYQSAHIAAADFPGKVFVVDSRSISLGAGVLAEYALSRVNAGAGAPELAAELEQLRERCCVLGLFDTLEYLKKGGRISKTTALAGGILGVKPILGVRDGMIAMLGKARGSRQGCKTLLQMIQENHIDRQLPVLFGYTGLSAAPLEMLLQNDTGTFSEQTVRQSTVQIGSVIGTHAGPGAIAVALFRQ